MTDSRNNRKRTHGLRAVLPSLLFPVVLLAVFLLGAGTATAGTFQISPTLGDVPPGKSTATFRIRNPGDAPLTVQVRAYRWNQAGDEDRLTPADDLIIVPPLITISPCASQLIRIAHKRRDASSEAAYRVHFEEVPPAPPAGFVGLQTALKLDVPLFFAPQNPVGKLEWRAKKSGDRLSLHINNIGNRFARFGDIALKDGSGRIVARIKGPQYALAGASRQWEFAGLGKLARGTTLTVIADMGAVSQEVPLTIE